MKDKIGDYARLIHILSSINEINSYVADKSFQEFSQNSMMIYASVKHLEIIGEAVNQLSDSLKSKYPEIPWRDLLV